MAQLVDIEDVHKLVGERLSRNPKYRELEHKYFQMVSKGKLAQAIETKRRLTAMKDDEVRRHCKSLDSQYFSIGDILRALEPAEQARFRDLLDVITISVDVIDTCVRDLDEVPPTYGMPYASSSNLTRCK